MYVARADRIPIGRLWLALLVAAELSLPAVESRAGEFLVTSEIDQVDANPGDGICDTGTDECTLRAAVMEANASPGSDTILLPAGDYPLVLPVPLGTFTDSNEEFGDLDVFEDLQIRGRPDNPASVVIRPVARPSPARLSAMFVRRRR